MILFGILFTTGVVATSYAKDDPVEQMSHHHMMQMSATNTDDRISLELSPQMKQHQLSNMRSHLVAIQDIIGFIAAEDFNQASQIAHSKLGLTESMRKMCNMFDNNAFKKLGLAFHESGDVLGDVLQEKDTVKSLQALRNTMNYCIQCHATFRQ
jgi:hypothetical protein